MGYVALLVAARVLRRQLHGAEDGPLAVEWCERKAAMATTAELTAMRRWRVAKAPVARRSGPRPRGRK